MQLVVKHHPSVKLDEVVVNKILNLYPEERLSERRLFAEGLGGRSIEFRDFKEECVKLLLPWQLFLLTEKALDLDLAHVETLRQKLSDKLLAKRRGRGQITSRRILDRLIRCQNFVVENGVFPANPFCGALIGKPLQSAADHIRTHFKIDRAIFQAKKQGRCSQISHRKNRSR